MVVTEAITDMPIPAWDDAGVLRPAGKLEVHRLGLRHPAVSVFVLRGDEILIQRRASGKYHTPGLWANTCCTHPNWGEAASDCARRRLDEELGIRGLGLRHVGQVEYRAEVPGLNGPLIEHEVVEVFVGQAVSRLPMELDPDEVSAVRWVTLARLREEIARNPGDFTPWFRIYVKDHATMILGPSAGAEVVKDQA